MEPEAAVEPETVAEPEAAMEPEAVVEPEPIMEPAVVEPEAVMQDEAPMVPEVTEKENATMIFEDAGKMPFAKQLGEQWPMYANAVEGLAPKDVNVQPLYAQPMDLA